MIAPEMRRGEAELRLLSVDALASLQGFGVAGGVGRYIL